jgi:hypothetical protein
MHVRHWPVAVGTPSPLVSPHRRGEVGNGCDGCCANVSELGLLEQGSNACEGVCCELRVCSGHRGWGEIQGRPIRVHVGFFIAWREF